MNEQVTARYGIDPYLDWVKKEGLPAAANEAVLASVGLASM